ncbi:MAG: hypothetical protein KTR31_41395 [Myxococcales bacterium]|nr:hypothetical protein [Myxococcales bacterium]
MTRYLTLVGLLTACEPATTSTTPTSRDTTATEAPPVDIRVRGFELGFDGVAYLHAPDGAYLSQVPLDAAGHAEVHDVPPEAMITVALATEYGTELATVRHVAAGQQLVLGTHLDESSFEVEVRYDASVVPGADYVMLYLGCEQRWGPLDGPVTLVVPLQCADAYNTVAVVAHDAAYRPIAYAALHDVATDSEVAVDLKPDDWQLDLDTVRVLATDAEARGGVDIGVIALEGRTAAFLDEAGALVDPGGTFLHEATVVRDVPHLAYAQLFANDAQSLSVLPLSTTQPQLEIALSDTLLPFVDTPILDDDGLGASATATRPMRCDPAGDADLTLWSWFADSPDGTSLTWRSSHAGAQLDARLPDLGPDMQRWWPAGRTDEAAHVSVLAHATLDFDQLRTPVLSPGGLEALVFDVSTLAPECVSIAAD